MLERDIEKKVCEYAKSLGILAYKFTSPQRRSVPDRLFIAPGGVIFFIEFKQTGKTFTKGQEREAIRLADNGADVYLVDSVEGGKVLLNGIVVEVHP